MAEGKPAVPGPFYEDGAMICELVEGNEDWIALFQDHHDAPKVDEIIALLNKGTHYDALLAMCKRIIAETESPGFGQLYQAHIQQHGEPYRGDEFCIDLRTAIAKAEGQDDG